MVGTVSSSLFPPPPPSPRLPRCQRELSCGHGWSAGEGGLARGGGGGSSWGLGQCLCAPTLRDPDLV